MSHELAEPRHMGQVQSGDPERASTGSAAPGKPNLALALHHVALHITRATNLHAALLDISRTIAIELNLHSVGFGIAPDGWVACWGRELDDLVVPAFETSTHGAPEDPAASGVDSHDTYRETPLSENHAHDPPLAVDDDIEAGGRALCLPIHAAGERHGVMLATAHEGASFNSALVDALGQVAALLGAAFERELQAASATPAPAAQAEPAETGDTVEQLLELLAWLATLPAIDGSIQPLLAGIAALFDARSATLMITDSANLECYSSSAGALDAVDDTYLDLLMAPFVRRAIGTLRAQEGTFARRRRDSLRPATWLAVPLSIRAEAVGALLLERESSFTGAECGHAATIARHLSFSVERERRMRTYSRQNLLLSLVERVTASFARSTTADDLFFRMAREIRRSFGYDCSIAMIEDNRLVFRAIELDDPEQMPNWVSEGIPLEIGVMGRVARTGQPAFLPDVSEDPAFLDTGRGSGSEIAVPIRVGDEVVGVINVESGPLKPLETLDFEIMLILANHIGIALNNRQLIASERESRMAIEAVQRVTTIVAETLDPEESLRRIADTLGETMGYPIVTLAILEGDELVLKANYGHDPEKMLYSININAGISGRVARTGQPVFIANVLDEPDYVQMRTDLTSEICVPIRCNGEIAGILNVEGTLERPLTERDLHLLTTFAEHAGVLLNNALAYAALSKEATLDPMTGVPNLRYFQQQLQIQLDHARREHTPLSLAVIDMDYLKHINDSYGHLVGDQVLRELARRMQAQLRGVDLLARYAGDEFVAILPGVDEAQASEVAHRLVEAARGTPLILPEIPPIQLSISIGVASYPADASGSTDLLRAADMAMYVAKESGKNRVSTARQSAQVRQR